MCVERYESEANWERTFHFLLEGCCKLAKGVAKKTEQQRVWLSIYVSRTNGNLFFFHLKLEGFPYLCG